MQLGEFKTEVKAALKRGDAFDDQIPGFIRRAARWVEQNYTLQYMRKQAVLDVEGDSPEVDLPEGLPIKTVEYVTFPTLFGRGDRIHTARKGELSDMEWGQQTGYAPELFYLDGVERLVFNGLFGTDVQGVAMIVRYSDWPNKDGLTHWLLQNAESLMLTQTLIEASVVTRDQRTWEMLRQQRDEQIRVLLSADYEMRYAGQDIVLVP